MANEAEIINNPDSTPGAVSTGYQLQNTNMVAARVGEDKTVVEGGTGECVLKLSGPVDVNGTLYTINTDVTFTLTTAGAYYIHLSGSGANLTPTIGSVATYPHTFDPDKNARYTDTGSYRVLNWIIHYDGTTARAAKCEPANEIPVYGFLDDGTPVYAKSLPFEISGTSVSVLHGIGNAFTNDRILSISAVTSHIQVGLDYTVFRLLSCSDTHATLTVTSPQSGLPGKFLIIYK